MWLVYAYYMPIALLKVMSCVEHLMNHLVLDRIEYDGFIFVGALRKDFVILQLYWWLFISTKHCG